MLVSGNRRIGPRVVSDVVSRVVVLLGVGI
jgi:hypothetical protein